MGITRHVEMRLGESWDALTGDFMAWCCHEKRLRSGGCHEGDAKEFGDDRRYAAITVPEHSPHILEYLHEWARLQGRIVK
jgi:hypothetical protein